MDQLGLAELHAEYMHTLNAISVPEQVTQQPSNKGLIQKIWDANWIANTSNGVKPASDVVYLDGEFVPVTQLAQNFTPMGMEHYLF